MKSKIQTSVIIKLNPFKICIGTYANEGTKRMEKLTRIVKKEDSIREMLTCGTVVFDISVDREELKLALEYLTGDDISCFISVGNRIQIFIIIILRVTRHPLLRIKGTGTYLSAILT